MLEQGGQVMMMMMMMMMMVMMMMMIMIIMMIMTTKATTRPRDTKRLERGSRVYIADNKVDSVRRSFSLLCLGGCCFRTDSVAAT